MVCSLVQNFTDNTIVFDFDDEHLVGRLSVIVQKIFSFLEIFATNISLLKID